MNLGEIFETGTICTQSTTVESGSLDFIPHNSFEGVFLKHLVKGAETNNQISCHLVKIAPFCSLEMHDHGANLEIHEVVAGAGECQIADRKMDYKAGVISVIPVGIPHKVVAGKDGLYMLAKFTPALL